MKIKSDLRLAAEDLADAVQEFAIAILETAIVKKVMTILFVTFLVLGSLGFLWLVVAILCLPFRGEGADEWLKTFAIAYPWLSGIWLVISLGAAAFWAWTISIELKPQNELKTQK
jgi:hypothetical protein